MGSKSVLNSQNRSSGHLTHSYALNPDFTVPTVNRMKSVAHNRRKLQPSRENDYKNGRSGKSQITHNDGDDQASVRGTMQQYCVKGSEVILRDIHFMRNDGTKMLLVSVPNKKNLTDTYVIMFAKSVCPYSFKDTDAFVLKVIDSENRTKSMTFKARDTKEKAEWLDVYGIKLEDASKLLNVCIEEIERRRFHLGVKKRYEDRNNSRLTLDLIVELLDSVRASAPLDFSSESNWSITMLERMIQTLLNEIPEPVIPYMAQKNIRKTVKASFNASSECRRFLNVIPNKTRTMLVSLLAHMERLSKYYLIVMSSPRKDLPHIRHNICQRLAPIIFRLQEDLDSEIIITRAHELLYQTMLFVNGATDSVN